MENVDGNIRIGLDIKASPIKELKDEFKNINKEIDEISASFDLLFKSFNKSYSGANISAFASKLISEMHYLSNEAGNLKTGLSNVFPSNINDNHYDTKIQSLSERLSSATLAAEIFKKTIQSLGNTGVDLTEFEKAFSSEFASIMPKISDSIQLYASKSETGGSGLFDDILNKTSYSFKKPDTLSIKEEYSRLIKDLEDSLREQGKSLIDLDELIDFDNIDFGNTISSIENMASEAGVSFSQLLDTQALNDDVKSIIAKVKELSQATKGVASGDNLNSEGIANLRKEYEKLKSTRESLSNYKDSVGEISFSAGTSELDAALKRVDSNITELENKLANAFKLDYKNSLGEISNKLVTVKKAVEGIKLNFDRTGDVEQAKKGLEALKNKINELKAKRDSLNDAYDKGIISEIEFIADTADIDKTIDELESKTVEIEADIKSSNKFGLSSLTSQVGSIKNLAGKIGSKLTLVTGVVKGTLTVYKALGKVSQFFTENLKVAVSRMKAVNTAIKDTVVSFAKLTKGAFEFMHDITSVIPVAKDLKESLNNLGFGDLVGADLLADVIREATSALKEFGKSSLDEGSNFQAAYLRIKDTFGDARDEIYSFAKTSKDSLGMSETKYLEAAGKIGVFARSYISDTEELAKVTNSLAISIADLSAQTGFSIDETMDKVLSGLRGNTEAIEELGINVKVADMQNWLDTQGINAKFENLNSNMQNLYRTWYMLDKVATNGAMGYAAKMMNTFSGQVRILQANLSDLKTTIGTYLMQALVPVLQIVNMVLSRLVDLANMIGKVFGFKDKYSLADSIGSVDTSGFSDIYDDGKEAISDAVDEQNKLTDATNKTTDATNKAAAAAKKALAPFHKLNVLSSNKDSGSGAGSGAGLGAGVNAGVGLGSAIKVDKVDTSESEKVADAWLEALKEAIENEEWYAVGFLFAQKANEAISKIKSTLEKVQPYLTKWAKNIADILNGFVSGFDWNNLGSTVATAINVITSALLTFTKNVNWDKIGEGVSKFFRGLLKDTDWTAVGELWTEKTRIFIEMLHGFVTDMSEVDPESGLTGWEELGTSLSELVTSMINNIPWETLGSTIAGALNGISDTVIKFTEEFNAGEEISKIVKGINKALNEFDAKKFSTAASGVINEVLEALKTAVKETDWSTLGTKLGQAIFGTLGKINWDDVAETFEGALDGVLDFAAMFVVAFNQNHEKIKEGIKKVFDKIVDWLQDKDNQKAISTAINTFIQDLVDIISDQDWSGLYDALGEILDDIDWGSLAYLIKLPDVIAKSIQDTASVAMIESAFKFLFQGIADDISGIVKSITDKFDELKTGLATTFDNIKTSVSTKWEEIKTSIGTSVDNIKESVSTKFEEIKTSLDTTWDNIKTSASTKWEEIKTSISGVVDSLKEGLSTKWEEIKTNLSTSWENIKTEASTKWEEIKTSISTAVENIKTELGTKWEEIKTNLSTSWESIKTEASTKWDEIKTSISGVVSNLKTDIESKWTTLKTNTLNVFEGIKNGVVNLFTNISTAIKSPINSIISLVESMVNKIIDGVNGAIDTLNKFSIDVPDDVPVIGGKKWGFNISKLSSISIPRLANGAVIKPNQRFLAELGDQTRGINIETPLDTMLDAFRGALNDYNGTGDIIIPIYVNDELNSEEIIRRQDIARYRSNGK